MTDETSAPEAAPEAAPAPKPLTLDDIHNVAELRQLLLTATAEQTAWAQERVRTTGYQQAVQAELALNRTDLHSFIVHGVLKMLDMQQAEIVEISKRLVEISAALVTLAANQLEGK